MVLLSTRSNDTQLELAHAKALYMQGLLTFRHTSQQHLQGSGPDLPQRPLPPSAAEWAEKLRQIRTRTPSHRKPLQSVQNQEGRQTYTQRFHNNTEDKLSRKERELHDREAQLEEREFLLRRKQVQETEELNELKRALLTEHLKLERQREEVKEARLLLSLTQCRATDMLLHEHGPWVVEQMRLAGPLDRCVERDLAPEGARNPVRPIVNVDGEFTANVTNCNSRQREARDTAVQTIDLSITDAGKPRRVSPHQNENSLLENLLNRTYSAPSRPYHQPWHFGGSSVFQTREPMPIDPTGAITTQLRQLQQMQNDVASRELALQRKLELLEVEKQESRRAAARLAAPVPFTPVESPHRGQELVFQQRQRDLHVSESEERTKIENDCRQGAVALHSQLQVLLISLAQQRIVQLENYERAKPRPAEKDHDAVLQQVHSAREQIGAHHIESQQGNADAERENKEKQLAEEAEARRKEEMQRQLEAERARLARLQKEAFSGIAAAVALCSSAAAVIAEGTRVKLEQDRLRAEVLRAELIAEERAATERATDAATQLAAQAAEQKALAESQELERVAREKKQRIETDEHRARSVIAFDETRLFHDLRMRAKTTAEQIQRDIRLRELVRSRVPPITGTPSKELPQPVVALAPKPKPKPAAGPLSDAAKYIIKIQPGQALWCMKGIVENLEVALRKAEDIEVADDDDEHPYNFLSHRDRPLPTWAHRKKLLDTLLANKSLGNRQEDAQTKALALGDLVKFFPPTGTSDHGLIQQHTVDSLRRGDAFAVGASPQTMDALKLLSWHLSHVKKYASSWFVSVLDFYANASLAQLVVDSREACSEPLRNLLTNLISSQDFSYNSIERPLSTRASAARPKGFGPSFTASSTDMSAAAIARAAAPVSSEGSDEDPQPVAAAVVPLQPRRVPPLTITAQTPSTRPNVGRGGRGMGRGMKFGHQSSESEPEPVISRPAAPSDDDEFS